MGRRGSTWAAGLLAAAVIGGFAPAWRVDGTRAVATAGLTTLERLHRAPAGELGRTVRLRVQFDGELEAWNPFLTRFGSDDYRAFRVWSDAQFLWEPGAWSAPLGTLYARRGTPPAAALAACARLGRLEVTVRVRQVFADRPWLEVDAVEPMAGAIEEGSIVHAARALRWLDERRYSAAVADLERALVGPMPDDARTELRRLRDEAQARKSPAALRR